MGITDGKKDKKMNVPGEEVCPVCTYPADECVCCAECGHDCPLEAGEPYCPVCSPVSARPVEARL
ncbi:MAG: hypothetical protein A2054_02440 [Deltaproteobacteria bacterium GWA2_55_10]|nr:MAG: hypothetical protein A2054_02440 [Deltaproteobacteria bacterium GWA2_55_10]